LIDKSRPLKSYNFGMRRIIPAIALLGALVSSGATNPPSGQASNESVSVAAVFLDSAAVVQATGTDFTPNFTVISATITPRGGKPVDVEPDDFLLRVESDSDHTGPLPAAQVLGTGGLVLHKGEQEVVGINRTNPGWSGTTAVQGAVPAPAAAIKALQDKMLPAKTTSDPVSGLLFFPISKKKPKSLDLVYSTPAGKLHIAFR
jgi:hypothetical protein